MVNNDQNHSKYLLRKFGQIGKIILAGIGLLLLVRLMMPSPHITHAADSATSPLIDPLAVSTMISPCETDALVLAEYQAWHGLPSHLQPPPYTSTESAVIISHILTAQAQCIDGFVVDWYGPLAGMPNDTDRDFIDRAFAELLRQAERYNFKVALMYDEGTLTGATTLTSSRAISDLLYATPYFTSPGYLKIAGQPALFVYPYETIDPVIDWQAVRNRLPLDMTLLDKDPNPYDPTHDDLFDGFYAWAQPSSGVWRDDGWEWGEQYLRWFYNTMADPSYHNKVAIGGVWPGFDDTLASWGSDRYMWRRCGQTWYDTWRLVEEYNPSIVMIDTWNDFEEGTDIEYGVGDCLLPASAHTKCTGAGGQAAYTHVLTNTGTLTDTFNLTATSSRGWPIATSLNSVMLPAHTSVPLTVTLDVPQGISIYGQEDILVITATSTISPEVKNSVTDITTAPCLLCLPAILKE